MFHGGVEGRFTVVFGVLAVDRRERSEREGMRREKEDREMKRDLRFGTKPLFHQPCDFFHVVSR